MISELLFKIIRDTRLKLITRGDDQSVIRIELSSDDHDELEKEYNYPLFGTSFHFYQTSVTQSHDNKSYIVLKYNDLEYSRKEIINGNLVSNI